jgi:hypothetical protein
MKITLKLSPDQALAMDKLFQNTVAFNAVTNNEKSAKSICFDIQDKTDVLARKVKRSNDLFNNKKRFNLNLKFHEAHTAYLFITTNLPATNHNLYLQQVHDQLHQKLI